MSNRTIAGMLDLAALAAPRGICANCYRTYVATTPRPPFVWCWHSRTVARQRQDGSWKALTGVTPDELQALQAGAANAQP